MPGTAAPSILAPYVPRLIRGWSEAPTGRALARWTDRSSLSTSPGSPHSPSDLASTAKPAQKSSSAESAVFADLIDVAERHRGDVLKFRGDALLLFFEGERHAEAACGAASDMQWTIEETDDAASSVGPVELRMSAVSTPAPVTSS